MIELGLGIREWILDANPLILNLLKISAVLAAGLVGATFLARRSHDAGFTIVSWSLISALVLPLLGTALPKLNVVVKETQVASALIPPATAQEPILESVEIAPLPQTDVLQSESGTVEPPAAIGNSVEAAHPPVQWPDAAALALGIWLLGLSLMAMRWLFAHLSVRRTIADGREADTGKWADTLACIDDIPSGIRVVESDRPVMPMAYGILRPVVVVPVAGKEWDHQQRKAVLKHEVAHLRRRDTTWLALGRLAAAIHWFNPLSWLALHRLGILCERACDEEVLRSGAVASDYAMQLLEIAQHYQRPAAAIGMASRSQLPSRINHILNANRRRPMSPYASAAMAAFAVATIATVAAAEPTESHLEVPAPGAESPTAVPANSIEMPQQEQRQRNRGVSWANSRDDESYSMSWSNGDMRLRIEGEGEIRLNEAEDDIAAIGNDGWLRIEEEQGRRTWRLDVDYENDALRYRWTVDGRSRDFSDGGAEWLEQFLDMAIYRLGLAAEDRVQRIYAADGADGVFREVELIQSDYLKRVYLSILLEGNRLNSQQAERLLGFVAEMDSDYEKAELLTDLSADHLDNERIRASFVRAAVNMDSDYETRRVLDRIVSRSDLSPSIVRDILEIARGIDSDYELAELLTTLAANQDVTGDLQDDYLGLLADIDSDYELRRSLNAALRKGSLSGDNISLVLEATLNMESDFELAELHLSLLTDYDLDVDQQLTVLRSVNTIESSFERRRVLDGVRRQNPQSREVQLGMLNAAMELSADFELAEFLVGAQRAFLLDSEMRAAYLEAARTIDSDYELSRVLQSLITRNQLTDDEITSVLNTARSIGGDYEMASTLRSIASEQNLSEENRDLYRDVADEISGEYEYGRAMAGLRGR